MFDIESFLPDIFGTCDDNDEIVTGYGSEQGFKACQMSGNSKCRDFKGRIKEIAKECLDLLREPPECVDGDLSGSVCDDELAVLGFERRQEQTSRGEETYIVCNKYTGSFIAVTDDNGAVIVNAILYTQSLSCMLPALAVFNVLAGQTVDAKVIKHMMCTN